MSGSDIFAIGFGLVIVFVLVKAAGSYFRPVKRRANRRTDFGSNPNAIHGANAAGAFFAWNMFGSSARNGDDDQGYEADHSGGNDFSGFDGGGSGGGGDF